MSASLRRVTVELTPPQLRAVNSAVMTAVTAVQCGDYFDASVTPGTLERAADAITAAMIRQGVEP